MTDLTPIIRRLDRARAEAGPDHLLQVVLAIASGVDVPIGMVVDGAVVVGALTTSASFKHELLRAFRVEAEHFPGVESVLDIITRGVEREYEQDADDVRQGRERLASYPDDVSLDDIAAEDLKSVIAAIAPTQYCEVSDARILVGREWRTVAAIRVRVDRISAWWPLEADATTTVTYGASPVES